MKPNCTFADIADLVARHQRFGLACHVRPDGDAIGSLVALGLCLRALGKEVVMLSQDGVPEGLAFLPGTDQIIQPNGQTQDVEVAFALDTATRPRLGEGVLAALAPAATWVNIDHHVSNPRYGDLNFIDATAPATGEVLFNLVSELGWPLTRQMAENLFTAISTDTGSFQYANTTAKTYRIAAALIEAGIDVGQISQQLYENYPLRRLTLLRALLNVVQFSADQRVASWRLTQDMAQKLGIIPDDTEGLIDTIRSVQGVIVAVFFEELPDGKIRVSARSKSPEVDVGHVCGLFGGGGHKLAAGTRMAGPIEEAEAKFLHSVYEAL